MSSTADDVHRQLHLYEAAPVPLLVADGEGTIVFTNTALAVLFGYEPGELLGRAVEVLVPPEVAAGHPELRRAFGEVPYRRTMGLGRDLQGMTRSGGRLAVEIGLNAVEIAGERHIVASVLDVTSLRIQQQKTRLAVDASASAMIMVDTNTRIVMANRQAVAMFGYPEDDLLGETIEILIPERIRRRHEVYRNGYLTDPARRSMGAERRDLRGRRADGSEFPLEIGLTPIEEGNQQMVMATIIDITERKRAEEEITRQNADLVRLNGELTQFAYSASHDLRSPLTTLDGLLRCIQEDIEGNELDRARVDSIRAQQLTARLANLIEDVLGFAHAENLELHIGDVELAVVIDELRNELEALLTESDVELRNEADPGQAVRTDRRRLIQILRNLISNGAKFADPDSTERFVAVRLDPFGEEAEIRVTDNGIGIPSAHRDQVFSMFRRFTNHDKDGSGLGLALVKKHVDQLGATIALLDTSVGTAFSIKLPAQPRGDLGAEPSVDRGERKASQS